ncbi:MAG: hypothetical protein ACYCOR_09810 [Acidobacteriaceae bacterium]
MIRTLDTLVHTLKHALRTRDAILADTERWLTQLGLVRLNHDTDTYLDTDTEIDYCPTPALALLGIAVLFDQKAAALRDEILSYNKFDNRQRDGRARQGALALTLREGSGGRPCTFHWRIAVRGFQGRWIMVSTSKKSDRVGHPQHRLTRRFVRRTGNGQHWRAYEEFDRRAAALEQLRKKIVARFSFLRHVARLEAEVANVPAPAAVAAKNEVPAVKCRSRSKP